MMVEVARVDHLTAWAMPLGYAMSLVDEHRRLHPPSKQESPWDGISDEPLRTESGFEHAPGMSKLMRMVGRG